jgi:neutral ceramidase
MRLSLLARAACATLAASLVGCDSGSGVQNPADAGADSGSDAGPDAGALDPPHCPFETPPAHSSGGAVEAAEVRAGLGSRVLPMPIGAPLGGYGNRLIPLGQSVAADKRPRRFTKSFVPSVGIHDAPKAEAIAIEAGKERFVLVRVDTVLSLENSLYALESAIAPDGSMRGRVIVSASHSHAAWAGWQTSLVLMPGIDRPRSDLADRMITAMAGAAKDALAALAPAKIGFAVDGAFDPKDLVSHDRRMENNLVVGPDGDTAGKGKDPVVWVMRVDKADGTPLAAVVDLPVHGTVGDEFNPLVSTDAPGAIERALAAELGYPVLHFQGAAGDIAPGGDTGRAACPDQTRCLDMPRLEALGARAAALVAPLVKGVQTGDKAAIEVVTRTFPVRRSQSVKRPDGTELRYAPVSDDLTPDGVIFDKNGKIANPIDEFNTAAGAGLCGNSGAGSISGIPGAAGLGPYSSCVDLEGGRGIIFGLFQVNDTSPLPLCDTVRSTATAIRVDGVPSGPYLLLSAPGEPTAPFAAYLRSRSPAGPDRTLLLGYSDDHVGYLLTAEDWLSGGYEPSINLWGPLEGEMVIDGIVDVAKTAWTPELEDPEAGSSRFVDWQFPDTPPIAPLVTSNHGTVAPATPSIWWPDTLGPVDALPVTEVARAVGAARFVWYGGDPAVDLPVVFVEREAMPGKFEPLLDARGRPASSYEGAVVLTYAPDPLEDPAPQRHVYAAVWQPVPPDPYSLSAPLLPYSLPLGKYRFRVKGAAVGAMGSATYELASDPFDVKAAPLAPVSVAKKASDTLEITAALGPAPGLRALRDGACDTGVPLLGPWKVTVSFAAAPAKELMVTPDTAGKGIAKLTAADVAAAVSVDVRDPAGNGGVLALP